MKLQAASASTVKSAGQLTVGFVMSSTVTVKAHCAVFPLPSSAVKVTTCCVKCPIKIVAASISCVIVMSVSVVQLSVLVVPIAIGNV